jgi:hypothetical protein
VNNTSAFWRIDPHTLQDVALNPEALKNALDDDCPPFDRVRFLSLLNRESEALEEGLCLLADFPDRAKLLLLLAQVLQRQYRWHEAALLQEEALQLASTLVQEAHVRHHIGRRLFDE